MLTLFCGQYCSSLNAAPHFPASPLLVGLCVWRLHDLLNRGFLRSYPGWHTAFDPCIKSRP